MSKSLIIKDADFSQNGFISKNVIIDISKKDLFMYNPNGEGSIEGLTEELYIREYESGSDMELFIGTFAIDERFNYFLNYKYNVGSLVVVYIECDENFVCTYDPMLRTAGTPIKTFNFSIDTTHSPNTKYIRFGFSLSYGYSITRSLKES